MTTNNTLTLGSLTVNSPPCYELGSTICYSNVSTSFANGYHVISCFPALIKQEETEEGLKYLFAVPGCGKESILVTYLEQDSFFKVEADHVEFLDKSNPCKIHVNTDKFDLSKIECSVKNGLLKVLVPYFEDAVPKSVKVS
jgi:HSP20 family molecular chaperone IbpA